MSMTEALRGAYCPLIVPLRDEKIDYDTYGKLIERQIAEGTHGLLVNATSGEPTMSTLEESAQLGGLLRRGACALDHAHDVGLLHDQQVLAVDLDLRARPFAK